MRPFFRLGRLVGPRDSGAVIQAPQIGQGPLTAACERGAESKTPQLAQLNFTVGVAIAMVEIWRSIRHAEAFALPPQQQVWSFGIFVCDALQYRARGN